MNKKDLDKFFKKLAQKIALPLEVYITGGFASWYMGGDRPTEDIDFGISHLSSVEDVSEKIIQCSVELQIPVQFSEDISRWGMIGIKDYTSKARLHKKFKSIAVYILHPLFWSVGKMSRGTLDDIEDIVKVFKKQKIKVEDCLKIWARALLESPKSLESAQFIKRVENFLKNEARKIWGKKFDSEKRIQFFKKEIS